ncbi:Ycf51 family protein [Prochlorothrix hollandica]|uniref:DUF2518 family protein n=1 Tax=Prochlorothrix hollandica PCC 9006 = CALU 1027 TaxID=317619 RepID=A0A0M2PQS4_PROHO|nr:Ycf51 family protein [Prochlorothrix hollandica]KKI98880.1 hypothetical protein PROH_13615 [Prochlorothrix hollandica PCC 9006 = CALU 1027]
MSIVPEFLDAAKWLGLLTLLVAGLTILGFRLQWGIRFRLVGITGFLIVLGVGSFALSLGLYQHTAIPGAVAYTTVYDTGATHAVIVVKNDINPETLEATLRQAAYSLFSSGRYAQPGESQLVVRARTLIHPNPGISQPLYLGEVRRSLFQRADENMDVSIDESQFQILQQYQETSGIDIKS